MIREIQNKELRKAAIEQMKILVGLNDAKYNTFCIKLIFFCYSCIIELDTKTIKKLYEVVRGDVHEYGYEL